jgi:MoaA/NifB/PqqE/SkfB family radical SAM enzyme
MNLGTQTDQLPYLGIRYQIEYYKCNMTCPYCIVDWSKQKYNFDPEKFRAIVTEISKLPYNVSLRIGVGGEIFTSPEILSFLSNICNENNNIFGLSFSTNLQADWKTIIDPFLRSTNTRKLGIGCTLHDTVIEDIDLFFEKVSRLRESGVSPYVGYVALPQRIKYIRQYKKRCHELGVPFIMNALIGRVRGVEGANPNLIYPRDYILQELRELKELWDTPHSYQMLVEACSTRGMICSAGKNYLYIDSDGNVYPCNKIRFFMGNILKTGISLCLEDTICPMEICWCGNENQALRIVDKYYNRGRFLRLFHTKKEISLSRMYNGYNPSIFRNRRRPVLKRYKNAVPLLI